MTKLNPLGPSKNCRHFTNDIFQCIFLKENVWIPIIISRKFAPKGADNNIPTLFQIIAWHRIGHNLLSEPKLTRFTDAYMRLYREMS